MTMAMTLQGFVLLLPLILFSVLSFWQMNPVLFMITAGVAVMTGLSAPDILTGDTTTVLSLSTGLVMVLYSFLCLALAYITMFGRIRDSE